MDHLELRPLDVLTSSSPKIEMWLVVVSRVEALHDVGLFLFSPLTKFGISQESAKSSDFANYRFQDIANTFGFPDETLHLELVL